MTDNERLRVLNIPPDIRVRCIAILNRWLTDSVEPAEDALDVLMEVLAPHVAAQVAETERLIAHASEVAARTVVERLGPELDEARAQVAEKDAEIERLRADVTYLLDRQSGLLRNRDERIRERDAALAREATARRDALTLCDEWDRAAAYWREQDGDHAQTIQALLSCRASLLRAAVESPDREEKP